MEIKILLISILITLIFLFFKFGFNSIFNKLWDRFIEEPLENALTEHVPAFKPKTPHCYTPRLMGLMSAYKSHHFDVAENMLLDFPEDYRSFAFDMLAEMGDIQITEAWIAESDSEIPIIVKALSLIEDAWKARGDGFADTVSDSDAMTFFELLKQAKNSLLAIKKPDSEFEVNRLVALIIAYKGLSTDIKLIDQAFAQGIAIAPNHIGLHEVYFSAISPKWGGSTEKVQAVLNTLDTKPELLADIIKGMNYSDLLHYELLKDDEFIQEVREFVIRVTMSDVENIEDLHRATLYSVMSEIARIQAFAFEEKYFQLLDQCTQHAWKGNNLSNTGSFLKF